MFENLKQRLNSLNTHVDNEILAIRRDMDEVALKCMEAQEGNNEELEKLRAFRKAFEALS